MKQSGELPKVSIIIPVYNGSDYLDKATPALAMVS